MSKFAVIPRLGTLVAGGLILCAAFVSPALAVPFKMTFTTTVTTLLGPPTPGVSEGDVLSLEVIVDNGNASALSQSWSLADVLSAVATAGSYTATFVSPHCCGDPAFVTDGAGVLTWTEWFDTDNNNFDNLGSGSPWFAANTLQTSQFTYLDFVSDFPTIPTAWSITPAQVPEPATLLLITAGLAGLGTVRRRSRRARTSVA